ncbi:hypothetical protein MNBD_GAMMA22-1701 [hydrothermal vent metagenome]|uniref:DUF3135 domain-containing protein n=1 Tax=hydrothermal vent metagenome TaxID=652676 RepID=A0A3B1A490_9ZZZZ
MDSYKKRITEIDREFDFDKMMSLAQNNPEGFEKLRQELINNFIKSLPEENRHRMECLQWRIDQTRKQSKTPLAACMALTEMMWESFEQLNALFLEMNGAESSVKITTPLPTADILPFKTA